MLQAALRAIGARAAEVLADAGALSRLAGASAAYLALEPFRGRRTRLREVAVQSVRAGFDSLPLVMLISFLLGMILALQSAHELDKLGASNMVANLVAVGFTRELGPLITGIIVAGRFGSAVAAELGTMKVSQEIDALVVMGIDPAAFLVAPRILALLIALPCVQMFANLLGILGGLTIAVNVLELSANRYWVDSLNALRFDDIFSGLVKAGIFGSIIGLVGCHEGLRTHGGAEEVGRATTASVVRSILLIIAADLFATALFYLQGATR
jgi:phospholipid/cholesterol/gamma-HCH transport system permease protein